MNLSISSRGEATQRYVIRGGWGSTNDTVRVGEVSFELPNFTVSETQFHGVLELQQVASQAFEEFVHVGAECG